MEEIAGYLKQTGKYNQLLAKWHERGDEEIRFEILFAYWCERRNLSLNYEVNVNLENDKTVDFNFVTEGCVTVNLELVRPDLNKGIKEKLTGDVLQGYVLTSDHQDPDFRTCAQLIKLQWSLLEKVKKFPPYTESAFNILVADCGNIHAGMFDPLDLVMAMYGYSGDPKWQENWGGRKLIGMWEKGYSQRGSDMFNDRISAVIFVPEQEEDLLENALIALNPLKSREHRQQLLDELRVYKAFVDVQTVQ